MFSSTRDRFRQHSAISQIEALGGIVGFQHEWDSSRKCKSGLEAPGPHWIRRVLGNNFFAVVRAVIFDSAHISTSTFGLVRHLKTLKELGVVDCTLDSNSLSQLGGVPNLSYLSLCGTPLNEIDVESLKELKRLRTLVVTGTGLSNESVELLRRFLPQCQTYFEAEYSGPARLLLNEVR
jgi:hypothetical protein